MLHASERLLQALQQCACSAALEYLADKRTAGFQRGFGDIECRFEERAGAQMIGLAMSSGRRGHVGQHDVGATAERREQQRGRRGVEQIGLQGNDAVDWFHRQNIGRHNSAAVTHAMVRDLAPAAGRRAEIDHRDAGFEKMVLVVDFDQFIGRARAQSIPFGLRHIGIVELPLQPEL